jgi:hypothetical protein
MMTAISACVGLTGCASRAAPGGSTSAREDNGADTPEAAALGFEQSLDGDGPLRFDCLLVDEFSTFRAVVSGTPTASARRVGARWLVAVSYPDSGPVVYDVRYSDGSYCVRGEIDVPHKIAPSTPGRYSGNAITSPAPAGSSGH